MRKQTIKYYDDYDKGILIKHLKHGYLNELYYTSPKLKRDRQIKKAIKQCIYNQKENIGINTLENVGPELQNDREFVLSIIKYNGEILKDVSENLKNDKEIVLLAVQENGCALKYASKELQSNKGIVMIAVRSHGFALNYASKELQNDKIIVQIAAINNIVSLKYASEELKNNKDFILSLTEKNPKAVRYMGQSLENDQEIMRKSNKIKNEKMKNKQENYPKGEIEKIIEEIDKIIISLNEEENKFNIQTYKTDNTILNGVLSLTNKLKVAIIPNNKKIKQKTKQKTNNHLHFI